jgi:hypothetical protein
MCTMWPCAAHLNLHVYPCHQLSQWQC